MSKARIMVVEDEGIIAEDIQESLHDMGYEVTAVVASGAEALDKARFGVPDLVLMDVLLQGDMDGIQAAHLIRSELDIPIIYLTSYSDDRLLDRAKQTEPFAFMIKPFRERELRTNIEMALFKHELDKKLKETHQSFSIMLNSMGDAVISADSDGLVSFMNPMAETITGRSLKDALGKDVRDVFDAVDDRTGFHFRSLADDLIDNGRESKLKDKCNLLRNTQGEWIAIDSGAAPLRDGKGAVQGIIIVFRDVTERKKAEMRLRLLSASVEQASEGIAVTDLEGNLLFLNKAFANMHGGSPEYFQGRHIAVFHSEEQLEAVNAANREVFEKGVFSGEIWHARLDGSEFPGLMHNSVLRDDKGEVVGFIGALRDITEIKRTQEALRTSHEQLETYSSGLEQKVAERTRDLEESQRELKRYSESLEKANEALKLVIQGIEEQKRDVEKRVMHNINLTVTPIIDQLKTLDLPEAAEYLLQSLQFNLENLFSSFGLNMIKQAHNLTPREIRICEMIRSGLSSKQMAKVMGVSAQTILVHRKNNRKKLALTKSKHNLAAYLKANL